MEIAVDCDYTAAISSEQKGRIPRRQAEFEDCDVVLWAEARDWPLKLASQLVA
jgi:hypothetical protein